MEREKYSENGAALGGRVLDATSIELETVHAVTPAEIARVGANKKISMKD